MHGLAGNRHAFGVDFAPNYCSRSSAQSQLKRHHCYAVFFEYEHKPIFEEGQRLSTQLLDSLFSTNGAGKKALHECLVVDDVSKQGLVPTPCHKHTQAVKRRSVWARVSQQVCKDSNETTGDRYSADSNLFSFDDVPMYDDDDDDDDGDCDEIFKHSSSFVGKRLGQISRTGNRCVSNVPIFQAKQELSTRKRVPQDISADTGKNNELPDQLSIRHDCKEQFMVENDGDHRHDSVAWASHEKGNFPFHQDSCDDDDVPSRPLGSAFNPFRFARTYNLVALRVSLAECESLAYRLKGHLLNWPRISNIARVDGDDMDWDTVSFWADGKKGSEEGVKDSVLQAVYGTRAPSGRLMKRVKSAEKCSARHYEYLENISRPGRKALKQMKEERERQLEYTRTHYSKKYYMVELGSGCQNDEGYYDSGSLQLGGSSKKRWRGPFRLLLLDTKYAGQSELPMAVQMLLNECLGHGKRGPRREIVQCNLTLFYSYWSMEEIIEHLLPSRERAPPPIKVLGHVALLNLGEQSTSVKFLIGKVILDKHRPIVKTVANRSEPVEGQSLPTLEVLAGNHSLVTSIIENDVSFLVNLAKVNWDSELALERQRLIQRFNKKDIVCDVFAGAGALALPSAKKVWRVFANDPNRDVLKYLARNVDDNRLHAKIELYNLDGCAFLRKLLAFKRPVLMTQIVFSLPMSAEIALDALKGVFNRNTWPANQPLPTVHVYGYGNTPCHETDFGYLIVNRLGLDAEAVEVHGVKPLDAGRWWVCVSFQLPEWVAFHD